MDGVDARIGLKWLLSADSLYRRGGDGLGRSQFNDDGRRRRIPKAKYRGKTWLDYVAALIRRGSLTLWVTEEAVAAWHAPVTSRRVSRPVYSDLTIETGLALRLVLHITLRTDHSAGGKSKVRFPHFNINRDVSSTLLRRYL
jgi:hypothetical protein